jgi:hypothetical protein
MAFRPPYPQRLVRTQQPHQPVRLDSTNPLCRGLVFSAFPVGATFFDVVSNRYATVNSTPPTRVIRVPTAPPGAAASLERKANGAGSISWAVGTTGLDKVNGSWTMFTEGSGGGTAVEEDGWGSLDAALANGVFWNWRNDINGIEVGVNNAQYVNSGNVSLSNAGKHRVAIAGDGSKAYFFANRKLQNPAGTALTIKPNAGASQQTSILGVAAAGASSNSAAALCLAWNRVLTEGEYQQLYDNPWQVFAPLRVQDFTVSAAGGNTYSDGVTETASAVDVLSASGVLLVSQTETGAAADSPAASFVTTVSASETGSAADAPAASTVTAAVAAETGAASDTVASGGAATTGTMAETGSAADAPAAVQTTSGSVTEAGSAADSPAALKTTPGSVTEAGSAADTAAGSFVSSGTLTEAGTAADAADASALSSSTGVVAETGSAADAPAALAAGVASQQEAGAAADHPATTLIANAGVTEATTAADAPSAAWVTAAAVLEALTAADSRDRSSVVPAAGADTLAAADAPDALRLNLASVLDTLAATDHLAATAALAGVIGEVGTVLDAPAAGGNYHLGLTESATLSEIFASALFGAQIPTDRVLLVEAEDRTLTIEAEDRTLYISREG